MARWNVKPGGAGFVSDAPDLYTASTTTETSYYLLIKELWETLLSDRNLPFRVRIGTSEPRAGGYQTDRPDIALYDGDDFVCVYGEVKLPDQEIPEMAISTDRNDQVGRYLAQTGVVLLTNVRAVGLLACKPGYDRSPREPVPVEQRDLLEVVELWPSEKALGKREAIVPETWDALGDLLERVVTEFAPIGDPAALARILARQAKRAKGDLPERFDVVAALRDDYQTALGLTFEGEEGAEFFRSSLIQTAYYALFAGWTLWYRAHDGLPFEWERIERYLKIPFLGKLFYEFKHPDRLEELGLAPHLDRAVATLYRVDVDAFFSRFTPPDITEGTSPEAARLENRIAAITYFYEPFLEAFDPELRKELGVWYTPPEIVRYQVRKVDRLLREHLNCPRGFADERVVVLDPCCGTGAYLLEVVRYIAADVQQRGDKALLATELLQALCSRVIGFEILAAPFVIVQLQLYLLLTELGVSPDADQRPAVFLTNALTGWGGPEQVKLNFPELQEEHDAAQRVKRDAQIIVILGNPPYNRFAGAAISEEATLIDHYKGVRRRARKGRKGNDRPAKDEEQAMVQDGPSLLYQKWGIRKQLLDDLYIRFFRLAEKRIGVEADHGVVSFISNSSFLTGRSHPLMRESLLGSFHEIWVDNLNGDKYKTGKIVPKGLPGEGMSDQSIFTTDYNSVGIQVGTSITTCLKRPMQKTAPEATTLHYRDFWGRSALKRQALLASLGMDTWSEEQKGEARYRPEGPREYVRQSVTEESRWMFAPRQVSTGFESWPGLDELFPTSYQGVNPNRGLEGSLVETRRDVLDLRMKEYFTADDFDTIAIRHPALATPRAGYKPEEVWKRVRKESVFEPTRIVPYLLFPLDARWLYYEPEAKLLNRRRPAFWENLSGNEFLVTVPQPRRASESRPVLGRTLVDLHLHDRGSVCFPTHNKPGTRAGELFASSSEEPPAANLEPGVWEALSSAWGLHGDRHGDEAIELVGRLFRCALAVLHSPEYEEDHRDGISQDWAHLPVPKDRDLFERLAGAGDRIATLLDPWAGADGAVEESVGPERARRLGVATKVDGSAIRPDDLRVTVAYFGAAKGRWVERSYVDEENLIPAWGETTGNLYLNDEVFLSNVPIEVRRYELGGYPVLKKWLGYRQSARRGGEPLSLPELHHLRSIVQRLAALLAMRYELDNLYREASADAFTAEEMGVR